MATREDLRRHLLDGEGKLAAILINNLFDGGPTDDNAMRELVMAYGPPQDDSDREIRQLVLDHGRTHRPAA